MARKSHILKSISIILLINVLLVTLSSTSALGWVTVKNGTFSGMYEDEYNRVESGNSVLTASTPTGTTIKVYAKGKNNWFTPGEASINQVYDTAVPGNDYEYSGKSGKIYQSYVTYNLKADLSGSNKYIKVTVKLYYNDAVGQQVLAEYSRTYTSSISSTTSYTIYSGSGQLSANRGLYVEVTVRVYARSVYGQSTSIVEMNDGSNQLTLTGWAIQEYYSGIN